jgi:hypothetical protein
MMMEKYEPAMSPKLYKITRDMFRDVYVCRMCPELGYVVADDTAGARLVMNCEICEREGSLACACPGPRSERDVADSFIEEWYRTFTLIGSGGKHNE